MVGTLPVAPVQLPISRSRTYIRFDQLDSSLENINKWTKLGVATGSNPLNLPENFEELFIDIFVYDTTENIHITFYILKEMISENMRVTNGVFSNGYSSAQVLINNSLLSLVSAYYGTTNVTDKSTATVYYK